MNWIFIEDTLPRLGEKCLVKTIDEDVEIAIYNNSGTKKYPIYKWYSGCCHDVEDVKYWIYLSDLIDSSKSENRIYKNLKRISLRPTVVELD